MQSDENGGGDLLGIKPFGEATKIVAQGTVDGLSAFLRRLCLPAAEEFGYLIQDKVRGYRQRNLVAVLLAAQENLGDAALEVHAPPRLVGAVMEQGSWADAPELQAMWAGLLASACTPDGDDDSNLLFVDLLQRLTRGQVRILDYACKMTPKECTASGLIHTAGFPLELKPLQEIAGTTDIQRLDRELDHLRSLELLDNRGGFRVPEGPTTVAAVTPTALALHLYVRCQGSQESPADFFKLTKDTEQQ